MKSVKVEEENDVERDSKDHDRRDRKDRKRKRSPSPQDEKAKSPQPSRPVDEPELNETDVVLSWCKFIYLFIYFIKFPLTRGSLAKKNEKCDKVDEKF